MNWKKNTALFLAAEALSMFGSMVVQYAIMWHITLKTQSGAMMTLFFVLGFLPMFLISPFGGVWADRFNRKNLINIADGAIAVASLAVALLINYGYDQVWILLFCAVVRSLGQGVQSPAVGAFIPQIVPPEHLTRINGIQTSVQSLCMFASPMISGVLMSFAPLETLFFVDVISAGFAIVILFFFVEVPKSAPAPAAAPPLGEQKSIDYFRDMKEGIKYISQHGYVLRMIILAAVFTVFAAPSALLTPLQVTRNFGNDVWRLSAIEMTFSLGMMAGGILIGIWGGFKNRTHMMALACVLYGLESAALGLIGNFWIYLGVMAVTGLTMPLYNAPSMVMLQSSVDAAFMGRVLAVFGMVGSVMMPAGMLIFGPLADIVSIELLLIVSGTVIMFLCVPFLVSKTLKAAGAGLSAAER